MISHIKQIVDISSDVGYIDWFPESSKGLEIFFLDEIRISNTFDIVIRWFDDFIDNSRRKESLKRIKLWETLS